MKINDNHRIYLVCAAMFAVLCVTGCGCTSQEETATSVPDESITDGNEFTAGETPPAAPDGTVPDEMGDGGMPPEGMGEPGQGGPGQMDFASAAAALGVTEDELTAALGTEGGPMDLESAASALGVTVEELQEALGFTGEMPPDGVPPA